MEMGRVISKVKVGNYIDRVLEKPSENRREVEVEALVDTGAAHLCLPPAIIRELGLSLLEVRRVRTANGSVQRRIFGGVEITIGDRTIVGSVMENDESTPPLIGYLVLEEMDYVVDPKNQKLIGNPAHDGKWMTDLYHVA